jgi:ferrous iron transport protein B
MGHTIALAGNPNAGKTTLFNELTGARQHVGNYPGVTVEKKTGTYVNDGEKIDIVDLPGTYSLTAYSSEEVITRDFIVNEKPAVVVNIVDASSLERNLYLSLQLIELGAPVCIALNMMDVAKSRGISIDLDKLSLLMGVPVIPTVARSGKGKKALMERVMQMFEDNLLPKPLKVSYGNDIDHALIDMEACIKENNFLADRYPARWIALKYLENDKQIIDLGTQHNLLQSESLKRTAEDIAAHIDLTLDTYPEALIADHRYGFIKSVINQGVVSFEKGQDRYFVSDKIDKVLVNRFAGPIIMLGIILALYHFTFAYSEKPVELLESAFGWASNMVSAHMHEGLAKSLIISGIINGVGGVLGFVPLIMFMFFGITIIEDSGYLARIAFMMDRLLRIFGLHGSSVMAFIVSGGIAGGCAVPGIMATRTLKSPRERLATLLTVPFMNCGAKLPIFTLLVGAFFVEQKAMMMFLITIIAWSGALIIAKLLRISVIRGASTPFVMELPPYRMPTLKGLLIHTWERTWQYIKKAGTVILAISILLWAMMTFPMLPQSKTSDFEARRQELIRQSPEHIQKELASETKANLLSSDTRNLKNKLYQVNAMESEMALKHSAAGRIGVALEKVSHLTGFDWRINIALVGGFAAKEVIVSTLGTAYSMGDIDVESSSALSAKLAATPGWRPLVAFSMILFVMFYSPCFVSVVCIAKEAGTWKWGIFSIIFNTVVASILAVSVYQIGSALGF